MNLVLPVCLFVHPLVAEPLIRYFEVKVKVRGRSQRSASRGKVNVYHSIFKIRGSVCRVQQKTITLKK